MRPARATFFLLWMAAAVLVSPVSAQIPAYELKVEIRPGTMIVTFTTPTGQARAYLPDDITPGEPFSGSMESTRTYLFDFAGQMVRTDAGLFHWQTPTVKPGEFASLVLRDLRGKELARASVPVSAPGSRASSFRFPKFVQAGSAAPILGPFDGDASTASATLNGQRVSILAESRRKLVLRAPERAVGPVTLSLKKGSAEKSAETRSLIVDSKTTKSSLRLGETSPLDISVQGLAGIQSAVPLKLENRSPSLVNVFNGSTFFSRDLDYIFIRPTDVSEDGTFRVHRDLEGVQPGEFDVGLNLLIPQTEREEVEMILRTPAPRNEAPRIRAAALRTLDFDALPLVEEFLTDFELGSDAAFAALEADETRTLPRMLASMPSTGANIERIGLGWFLSHYAPAYSPASMRAARNAAMSLLNKPQGVGTDVMEMALFTMGIAGEPSDLALLQSFYGSGSRLPGARRLLDASEAALARLNSPVHIENLRRELAAPLPPNPGPAAAARLLEILQKAGFSGRPELLPGVCAHLDDGVVVDIDVKYDVQFAATRALGAIIEKRTPVGTLPRKTSEEWKTYCQEPARQ
jgi:hypothetical protein